VLVPILYLLLLLGCVGLAMWLGSATERWGGAILFLESIASPLVAQPHHARWHSIEPGILLVDFLGLAAFLILAIRSRRFWPIWAAAFQLLVVAANLAEASRTSSKAIGYALNEQFWAYPMLILLAIVSVRGHLRRQAMQAPYERF